MNSVASLSRRQYQQLFLTHSREALRNRRPYITMIIIFGGMSLGIAVVDLLLDANTGSVSSGSMIGSGLLVGSLPLIVLIGFTSLGLVNTGVPLTAYRADGILRQLGTTPISQACFLVTHLSVRLIIGLGQILLVLVLAAFFANLSLVQFLRTTVLMFAGLMLLLSVGYLIGARLQHPDRAMSFSFIVTIVLTATSGTTFPLSVLPVALSTALSWLPTTVFASGLAAELSGTPPLWPFSTTVLTLLGIAAIIFLYSNCVFQWSPRDHLSDNR